VDLTAPFSLAMVALLAILVLLPMYWLTVTSLTDDASNLTFSHYRHFVDDPSFIKPLVTTMWTSAAVGILCVAFAAPMGWLVARTHLPFKRTIRTLILASFVTPPFLGAFAWVLLGGPNAGILNQWYYGLTGLKPFEDASLINIFSAWGMVFVMALYTFPYVFTFVTNSLEVIPSDLEEASSILGAAPWQTALHVTMPLVMPALVAGFLVAFLQSMTLFGAPAILALPAGIDTMTTKIWSLFQFPPQLGLAAAASLPLLIVTVILLRVQAAIMGRRGYSVIGGKSTGQRLAKLGPWVVPAMGLFVFVLACSIILPYGVLVRTAFVKNWSAPMAGNLTLDNWKFVFFEFSQTKQALLNTFELGFAAATAGTLLATTVGYLAIRKLVWGHRYLAFLATAPVAIPGIVLAVGPFPRLYPAALRALRHARDHLPRLPHEGAAGGLPAGAGEPEERAPGAGGRKPNLRRHAPAGALGHHGPAHPQRRHRHLDLHLHRLHPRALGHDPALHREDQDHFGRDVRPAREQRLGADRRTIDHHARDHVPHDRGDLPLHRPERADVSQELTRYERHPRVVGEER
jgi:iron(III) transport system permease protein